MSNRGEFVGTAPTSGNYIPAPTPAEQEDLPVYVNDELLRLGGVVNGVLEGGSLPPHSELPKRYKEGMIMNFSNAVGDGVDSSGVWLYKNAKWWKLIDDPSEITEEINKKLDDIEDEINTIDAELLQLNTEITNLNDAELPALKTDLNKANQDIAQANQDLLSVNQDLSTLDGKFPIKEVDISDDAISAPKIQANTISADKIVANTITGDKIAANTITGDKVVANTITGDKIVANSISGDKIVANSISGDKLLVNSIGADKIIANSITGSKINSATTIRAGTGNQSASLDGADSNWRIYAGSSTPSSAPFRVDKDGNLFAESGTFGGSVYADKVDGDFTDIILKHITSGTITSWPDSAGSPGVVTPIDLFDLKVRHPKPYTRIIRIDPIRFDMNSGGSSQWYHMLVYKRYLNPATGAPEGPEQVVVDNYEAAWGVYNDGQRKWNTSPVVHFEVPIDEAAQYRVAVGVESNTTGGETREQSISCSLFKQGSELSFA